MGPGGQMIRTRPGSDHAAALGQRAPDKLERVLPVEAHAALRGVHRLGHAEAPGPEVAAVRERGVPVDRRVEPGLLRRQWLGDHVCRGKRLAREWLFRTIEFSRFPY